MKATIIVTLLLLLCTNVSLAEMTLKVTAPSKCRVYVNGRYRGVTPAVIDKLPPGIHELEVLDSHTGEYRLFRVSAPKTGGVMRNYQVYFDRPAKITESVMVTRELIEEPVAAGIRRSTRGHRETPGAAHYYPPPRYEHKTGPHEKQVVHGPSREKVRRRNTILGLGLANELFHRNSSHKRRRKDIRKGAIAATLFNEIFTK